LELTPYVGGVSTPPIYRGGFGGNRWIGFPPKAPPKWGGGALYVGASLMLPINGSPATWTGGMVLPINGFPRNLDWRDHGMVWLALVKIHARPPRLHYLTSTGGHIKIQVHLRGCAAFHSSPRRPRELQHCAAEEEDVASWASAAVEDC